MTSFARMATVTASTKRVGAIVDGLEPVPTTHIASLSCLPLDPVTPDIAQGIEGLSFHEILQTYVDGGLDIQEGDLLVVDNAEYPIRSVADWTWRGSDFRTLFLEDAHLVTLGYSPRILALEPIAYWPQWEDSGVDAECLINSPAQDGSYTGVTLGQEGIGDGETCPFFDGLADYNNIYTTAFRDAFNGDEGTAIAWVKVTDVSVWTDGTTRHLLTLQADNDNRIWLTKAAGNNLMSLIYRAGAASETINFSTSTLGWLNVGLTWSKDLDEVRGFLNGIQQSTTQTALGNWAGVLIATRTLIGAKITTPTNVWDGYLAHVPVWDRALSPAEMASVGAV